MPSEKSAVLDNGTGWNAEHLTLEKSPTLQAPVVQQSASLDSHLQLDEQVSFGEPLRYDGEVSSDSTASYDAPLLDDAKKCCVTATSYDGCSIQFSSWMNGRTRGKSLSFGELLALHEIAVRRWGPETTRCNPTGDHSVLGEEWKM